MSKISNVVNTQAKYHHKVGEGKPKMSVLNIIRAKLIERIFTVLKRGSPYEINTTLFLVIQHADSLTQVTYLPMLSKAVAKGDAEPQQLALLTDRVLTRQGKKQIYGSQLRTNESTGKYEFFPIEDEPNVNKRRVSIGLGPLEQYAKYFGIDYTSPKTKK
jgi:hypothetical protein